MSKTKLQKRNVRIVILISVIGILLLVATIYYFTRQKSEFGPPLNVFSEEELRIMLCEQECTSLCKNGPQIDSIEWNKIEIETQKGRIICDEIIEKLPTTCDCSSSE
jgi:hypothetical protein